MSELCWDADPDNPNWHPLTTEYVYDGSSDDWSLRMIEPGQNYRLWLGLDLHWSDDGNNSPYLSLARYKISVCYYWDDYNYEVKDVLYIDYRTSAFIEDVSGSPDVNVYYDDDPDKQKLYYMDGTPGPIDKGIWELINIGNIKTELEPYPPDNFTITNQNQWNSNPHLSWNFSSEADYWDGFNVYRKEAVGSWQKIAELSMLATSYTDQQTVIQEAGPRISYQVKAVNGSSLSDPTPSIQVVGDVYKKGGDKRKTTFKLNQNYPNPFNPTTSISYSIPTNEFVNLKIYDSLGKEVAELVNENQSAGEYSIDFNGENLPSGLYIYKIAAGKYSDTRKLMLIK